MPPEAHISVSTRHRAQILKQRFEGAGSETEVVTISSKMHYSQLNRFRDGVAPLRAIPVSGSRVPVLRFRV